MRARADHYQTGLWGLPLFLLLVGISALAMMVPAVFGTVIDDHDTARPFLYAGLLGLIGFGLVALAVRGRKRRRDGVGPLIDLLAALTLLPVFLAVPFSDAVQTTTFFNAYIEMVSAITTTGAPVFEDPTRLNETLHLWRGMVAWLGGLMMWIAAAAILAPLNLGGFEVTTRAEPGNRRSADIVAAAPDVRIRIARAAGALVPVYAGLTLILWVLLFLSGESSFIAFCHAMSVLSTSGISPQGGLGPDGAGFVGEVLMLVFMLFALSRLTFSSDIKTSETDGLLADPEFRMGLTLVIGVPTLLFVRHWLGAFEFGEEDDVWRALDALWGALFTTMSFMSTTGFTSERWADAQAWSGLETPGLLLMGLAVIGGGVATTAGGVKLLRVYALYRHGLREMDLLIHPSAIAIGQGSGHRVQRDGAYIAWIFFMLFALAIAALTLAFAAAGVAFDTALILTVAGLSTTGPLIEVAADTPVRILELTPTAKSVFAAAMVIGRLETLAIVALMTPDIWRR